MKIYDVKVNHLVNPLGYRMNQTVFSWKVAEAVGTRQLKARIVVAADEQMENILCDTGFCSELNSLGQPMDIDLRPRTRYYWQVTVFSEKNEKACSEICWFETGKRDEKWNAFWITCDNKEKRHPYFEKIIEPRKDLKKARLYVCGLGLYELFLDNKKISNEYLLPYCNAYDKWVQYQTFDVTEEMSQGGKLSILLGNGWYKGRFGFASKPDSEGFYGNEWKLIAELHLIYEDGSEEVIGTDENWQIRRSNITFSNIYDGEQRDDTLQDLPLEKAVFTSAPEGELMERMSLPVIAQQIFEPTEIIHTPANETVIDMGQEFSGIFSLKIKEKVGTKIHIQTGEILQNGNFYNENLRSARSEYVYISDGNEIELVPHFTFYGYRYVKIDGITNLKKEDFKGIALYSDIESVGNISTGHKLLNRFIANVRWGLQSNFLDVPTDCPQRDERMGWTGDAQVFSGTATFLKDTYAFYSKYMYDMAMEQKKHGGKVPDVIPAFEIDSTACVWGDAACIIPWNLYLFYGDKSILQEQYESMKSWVEYVRQVDGANHGWRKVFHYGDWLALDNPNPGPETVLGGTDEEFIANLYYAISAEILSKTANVLDKHEDEIFYKQLSEKQIDTIKKEYYSSTGRCCIKTQTALLLSLKYHLSDNEELTKNQLIKTIEDADYKLKTGFVGTPLICNILSENGLDELAYKILLNEDYPGWLNEVKLGATTVWERWNSLLSDGTISGTKMNSMNHYSYGAVMEWMFKSMAGFMPKENNPGFKEICIAPKLNWKIKHVNTSYDSPAGLYKSSWEILDENHVKINIAIPFDARAELILPYAKKEIFNDANNPIFTNVKDGICILESGDYEITYELEKSIKPSFNVDTPIRELLKETEIYEEIKPIIDIKQIPMQYIGYSIKEIAQLSGIISDEALKLVDAKMGRF